MSQPPLRFVHASDFHLERPLGGIAEVPEHLRDLLLDAPFTAAQQVFETAVTEGVDALLLSGDVVDFENVGPRAVVFLAEQFQRLAEHGIAVYWASGNADPVGSWPSCVEMPQNVHIFAVGRVESLKHKRQGKTVALVQGISRSEDAELDDSGFHCDANGLFTVGIAYGTAAAPGAEGDRVHYMALGGNHRRQTVDQSPGIAHYSGTPQGRRPRESGPHGCTIVSVDDAGKVKTRFVATDAVRWVTETIEVVAGTDEDALFGLIEERIAKLRIKHQGTPLLVTWKIEGRGQLLNHVRSGGISDDITTLLREKHGHEQPVLWTVALECSSPLDVPREWYDEETIMGDVLREFRNLEESSEVPLELEGFLPEELRDTPLAELATVAEHDRGALLWAASKMAVDMMDGEEELTVQSD
jgi:exonuclease SbcD